MMAQGYRVSQSYYAAMRVHECVGGRTQHYARKCVKKCTKKCTHPAANIQGILP